MNGRNILMGYLDEKEKTLEVLDARGLMHSGDLGKLDEDGFYYVTGRIKGLTSQMNYQKLLNLKGYLI